MIIKTMIDNYDIETDDYINKPILKNGKTVGTIVKAKLSPLGVVIEGIIWDECISTVIDFTDNEDKRICNSISITIK